MKTLLVRSSVFCVLAIAAWPQQVIVINPPQAQPSTVMMVDRPVPARAVEAFVPAQPVTYLIALKDNDIRIADQYWVKNGVLYYLLADHQQRMVPVNSLDLALTVRLNNERNVAFFLPTEQERTATRSRVVRRTAAVVHKRCICTDTRSARASSPAAGAASRAVPAPTR